MIVNSLKDGWEVIFQRSHANVAAMLVAAWQKKDHVPRWTELIIATAQHDDQEMFWKESQHLSDIGAPLDFTQGDMDATLEQAQLVIDNAYRQGAWIAILISMHNSFLYEPLRGEGKKLDAFLDRQKQNQAQWLKMLNFSRTEAETAYTFLCWGDCLSLILCRREVPERERAIDVAPDKNGRMIRVHQRPDETLALDHWIFDADEFTVSTEVRCLQQLEFDSESAFRKALEAADIEIRKWHFKK